MDYHFLTTADNDILIALGGVFQHFHLHQMTVLLSIQDNVKE